MNKILLFENKSDIARAKEGLTRALPLLQEFSSKLKEMTPESPERFDHEDLAKLINPRIVPAETVNNQSVSAPIRDIILAVRDIIFDKLTKDKDGTLYGLPVSKSTAKSLIEFPDLSGLVAVADEINSLFKSYSIDPLHFEISKNGKINIVGDAYTKIEESFRVYAETPEQIKRLKAAQKVAEGMKELADLNCLGANGIESFRIRGMFLALINYAGENTIEIDVQWIKTGRPS